MGGQGCFKIKEEPKIAVIQGGTVIQGAQRRASSPLAGGEGAGYAGGGAGWLWAKAKFDFAVEGGLVSTIGLIGRLDLPSGSIICGGFVKVVTPPTSGGAGTLALTTGEGAGDLVAAAAVSGAPWSTTGLKNIVPRLNDATTWITLTAARDISAAIATAALTAGVVEVYLAYLAPTD